MGDKDKREEVNDLGPCSMAALWDAPSMGWVTEEFLLTKGTKGASQKEMIKSLHSVFLTAGDRKKTL